MLYPPENIEYTVSVVQSKPWRMFVTLTEHRLERRKKIATGRSWSEPFDPVRGDPAELEGRFRLRIASEPMLGEEPTEVLQHDLADCFCIECRPIPPRFFQLIKKWRLRRSQGGQRA